MDQNIKRGRGRPRVFSDDERKNHKTAYMLNKEWYCIICNNDKNYTLAGKSCHLKTKKHINTVKSIYMKENMQKRSLVIKNKIIEMNNELARIQR